MNESPKSVTTATTLENRDLLITTTSEEQWLVLDKYIHWRENENPRATVKRMEAMETFLVGGGNKGRADDFRGYYFAECETAFGKPYIELLQKWTGYVTGLEAIELIPEVRSHFQFSHFVDHATLDGDGMVTASGYGRVYDEKLPSEVTAEKRASDAFADYINEWLGRREPVPEHIEDNKGRLHINPKYATGFKNPLLRELPDFNGGKYIFRLVFNRWMETMASAAQKELIGRIATSRDQFCPIEPKDYNVYVHGEGDINWGENIPTVGVLSRVEFRTRMISLK